MGKIKQLILVAMLLTLLLNLCSCKIPFLDYPPEPKTKEAEFKFELVYKINNRTITYKDVLTCKFDGYGWDAGNGFFRKWNSDYGEAPIINLCTINNFKSLSGESEYVIDGPGYYYIKVGFWIGSIGYFMNDPDFSQNSDAYVVVYRKNGDDASSNWSDISDKKLKETFNIEILSWKIEDQIENEFID